MKVALMRLALALPLAAALVAPRGPSSRPRGRLRQAADEYESTAVDGAFPADLEGTLYRLGPGSTLRRGEDRGAKDAHGVVCGVTFANGGAVARSRFVRTEAYVREQRDYDAGSAGAERNTGSGAALYWAGKLYALTDGCKPYQLDPLSCATQKKSELGGLLTNPADGFAAVNPTHITNTRITRSIPVDVLISTRLCAPKCGPRDRRGSSKESRHLRHGIGRF